MEGTDRGDTMLSPTLTSDDYCSDDVWELDRRRIFHAGWMYVCHLDGLPPGTRRAVDLAGEAVVVTRDRDGTVRAFANVCRHRGSELCPIGSEPARGSIRCPYHAWTYGLDGTLLATPRVDDEFDRADYGLWEHRADTWNGLIFVSVADDPPPLRAWLTRHSPPFTDFDDVPSRGFRIGARTECEVNANWKIIIENYNECLHCAVVHPELVNIIPLYRTGHVVDPDRDDDAVEFRDGASALTLDGSSDLNVLPGVDATPEYGGVALFPNVLYDLTPTHLALTGLFPVAADRTLVTTEYLFHPDDVARDDFDPGPEIALAELIGHQDNEVCEMVQRGVASSSFTSGGLTEKDAYVAEFVDRYLALRDAEIGL